MKNAEERAVDAIETVVADAIQEELSLGGDHKTAARYALSAVADAGHTTTEL